jgi:zinc protease
MRLFVLSLLLAAAPALASKQAPGRSADGLFPYTIHERTLPNGLRVAVVPTDERGMFALREVIGVGARDEVEKGYSGFAHFFEHMMFRGTPRFPPDARGDLLTGLGVNEGGSTSDDQTVYRLTGPKAALATIFELEGDRYQHLSYSEDVFKTESRAVLGEYNKSIANPDLKAWFKLRETAFDRHTYKHTPIGFLADIQKMPERYDYAQKFFKRFYTPDNVLLVVTGDVLPDEVFALAERHFGKWSGKRAKTKVAAERPMRKPRESRASQETPTLERGFVAWHIPSALADPASNALCAILEAYLFASSSPLFDKLVRQDQLLEGLSTWWWPHKDPSLFPVYFRLREGKARAPAIDAIQAALDDIASGNVDKERFAAVKSHITYSKLMRLSSAEKIADALASAGGPSLDAGAFGDQLGAITARTPAELSTFVKATFDKRRRIITTVGFDAKGGSK